MENHNDRDLWHTQHQPERRAPLGADADAWQDKEGRLHREPPEEAEETDENPVAHGPIRNEEEERG